MSGPNADSAAPAQNAVPSLDAIAAKMAAMRNQVVENQTAATGSEQSAPVAPEGTEVLTDDNIESVEPEVELAEDGSVEDANETETGPDEVSPEDSSMEEVIDFLEFAETNPNAKFKFMKNGKEVTIDAKKAAAILGQGGAIHEEARQLKIKQAEFEEYVKNRTGETEGLMLAMEFTIQPKLREAYDEIVKTQQYQTTFRQQLAQTSDPGQVAKIQAAMEQNERYIAAQSDLIRTTKPQVDQFYAARAQQVRHVLDQTRKSFADKELRNEYVFNELRDRIGKGWQAKDAQLVPGVPNIDLVSSDEHIMSLLRDGLKYREKPRVKAAGNSIAALTSKRSSSASQGRSQDQEVQSLRDKARAGDKKAGDNLLTARLNQIRAARSGR